jgi:adenine/guanine phosphoribosyltransferase-like PRPP-binding protein
VKKLTYITYAQLYRDVLDFAHTLPPVKAVHGIPKSGMVPATMIANELMVPLTIGKGLRHGVTTDISSDTEGAILLVDDSVLTGTTMQAHRLALGDADVIRCCMYCAPDAQDEVDLCHSVVEVPRIFEWNLFNSWATTGGMFDMDGVFCKDPLVFDDDGPEYEQEISTAIPLHLPKTKVYSIVTNRIERWRDVTEGWLHHHGVEFGELHMQPYGTAEERRRKSNTAYYKATHYMASNCPLFVESDDAQAKAIAQIACRPVISLGAGRVYGHYARALV